MRSTIFALACGMGLMLSGAALADPQGQSQMQPQPVSATTQDPNNPVICHTFYHEGELIRSSECHTKHVWDNMRRQTQERINEDQLRSMQSMTK